MDTVMLYKLTRDAYRIKSEFTHLIERFFVKEFNQTCFQRL